jgi:hypothetical protein
MDSAICPSCGRGILKDHCWPCLAEENKRLKDIERNLWRDLADETRRGDKARAELEQLKKGMEELLAFNQQNVDAGYKALAERDEARKIATHLMQHSVDCWSYKAELIDAYPWMKERTDD